MTRLGIKDLQYNLLRVFRVVRDSQLMLPERYLVDKASGKRYYGCARRGCDRVNASYLAYGAYGKSWCLHHAPLRVRIRRLFGEDI